VKHNVAFLCLILAATGCRQGAPNEQAGTEKRSPATWQYDEYKDEMRGTRSWSATLQSLNQPTLGFPYEGGSPVYIRLSGTEGEGGEYAPEVVLENGQFDCSQYGGTTSCLITVKSDDHEPYDLRGVETDCGSAKCMRILDEGAIDAGDDGGVYSNVIEMIKKSKRLTIELPLYGYGSYQYQFDTSGLNWPKR
jgi:hypothetical protein